MILPYEKGRLFLVLKGLNPLLSFPKGLIRDAVSEG